MAIEEPPTNQYDKESLVFGLFMAVIIIFLPGILSGVIAGLATKNAAIGYATGVLVTIGLGLCYLLVMAVMKTCTRRLES